MMVLVFLKVTVRVMVVIGHMLMGMVVGVRRVHPWISSGHRIASRDRIIGGLWRCHRWLRRVLLLVLLLQRY